MTNHTMTVEAIKVQFPEVKFYMFAGRSGGKRIKGQWFPKDVAVPVWDRKTQILLKRLPYIKQVSEEQLGLGAVKQTKSEKKQPVNVPDDWRSLHWKRRIALARSISNENVLKIGDADAILERVKPSVQSEPPVVEAAPVTEEAPANG